MNASQAVKILTAHQFAAVVSDTGVVLALQHFSQRGHDGSFTSGSEWVAVPTKTLPALLGWLGY